MASILVSNEAISLDSASWTIDPYARIHALLVYSLAQIRHNRANFPHFWFLLWNWLIYLSIYICYPKGRKFKHRASLLVRRNSGNEADVSQCFSLCYFNVLNKNCHKTFTEIDQRKIVLFSNWQRKIYIWFFGDMTAPKKWSKCNYVWGDEIWIIRLQTLICQEIGYYLASFDLTGPVQIQLGSRLTSLRWFCVDWLNNKWPNY